MARPTSPPTWALLALAALAVVALSVWSIAACGPWDPWETHYGEVARQILVRNDPLDLWWRPGGGPDGNAENTFWSKPALPFWLMALSMKLLGVGTGAAPDEMVRAPWPELAIRLPSLLTGLACAAFLGWACARILAASRPLDPRQPTRAGLYTALALCTMPQWAIVSRQALTDMFFVAPVTVALAAWALAWLRPDRELRRRPLAGFLPRRLRDRFLPPGPPDHAPTSMSPAPSAPGTSPAPSAGPARATAAPGSAATATAATARAPSPPTARASSSATETAAPATAAPATAAPARAPSLPTAGTSSSATETAAPGSAAPAPAPAGPPSPAASAPAGPRPGRLAALLRREVPWDRAYLGFLLLFIVAVIVPIAVLDAHVSSDVTVSRVSRFVKKPGVPSFDTLVKIHRVLLAYGALALLLFLRTLRWRTASQVWMGVLYVAAGVSLVGKGLIGPGLVGLLVLLHLVVSGRLTPTQLWRCGLGTGFVLFALASLPWHHAMWIYRGDSWLNELIVVNNLARFGSGEQDQAVGGFAYYLRTLGLAALPWSAALPAVLWAAARRLRPAHVPENLPNTTGPDAHDPRPALAGPRPGHVPENLPNTTGPDAHAPSLAPAGPRPGHVPENLPPTTGPDAHVPRSDLADELWRFALLWFCATLALLTASVTKYYHYLLPTLPPFALLVGLWLSDPAPPPRDRRLAVVAAALGVGLLALVMRDILVEPAWIVHLTTYLYDHMWRNGAPTTTGLLVGAIPFALGLGLWAARRRTAGVVAMLLAGLLTLHYVLNSYLPAVSEHWSQRTAIRHYYDHRGPDDPLASWWFYYRGETFFTKATVWVKKEADREQLSELVEANRGQGRSLWLITTTSHMNRAKGSLPLDVRRTAEVVYENAHYSLLRAPIP